MSNRIEKVNALIQKELSKILLRDVDFPQGVLVTITRCDSSPNLSEAKIYVSVIFTRRSPAQPAGGPKGEGGPDNKIDKVFEILNRRIYDIQQILNRRLNMRPIPRIEFKKEENTKKAAQVEELLEELKEE